MSIRIGAIPPNGIPRYTVPLYGLPSLNVNFQSLRFLEILWGGIILEMPGVADSTVPIDLSGSVSKSVGNPDAIIFRFTARNPPDNPQAEITDFSNDGKIQFFTGLNSNPTPLGSTLGASEEFDLCFITDFNIDLLNPGINILTGAWNIKNNFAGFPNTIENYDINITYRVILPNNTTNGIFEDYARGRITPDAYIDEYVILNKRESESFKAGRSLSPGFGP